MCWDVNLIDDVLEPLEFLNESDEKVLVSSCKTLMLVRLVVGRLQGIVGASNEVTPAFSKYLQDGYTLQPAKPEAWADVKS